MSLAVPKPRLITSTTANPDSLFNAPADHSPTLSSQDDADAHSFVVSDGGLSRDLVREESEQRASPETKHVGAWASSPPLTPSTLGDTDFSLKAPIDYVEDQLRKAKRFPASFYGGSWDKRFVPRSDQKRIMSLENIRSVLKSQDLVPDKDLDSFTHMIHDVTHIGKQSTTMRIIFSILILLGKPNAIMDFIKAKIYDKDLPLRGIGEGGDDCLLASKGSDQCISLFKKWRAGECDLFLKYQWQFLVPIFHLPDPKTGKSCYWKLDSEAILPIMTTGQQPSKTECKVYGGSADVLEAEIHGAHLCHSASPESMLRVAIKRLRKTEPEDFDREFDALRVVSAEKSPHLTSLLFTFKHQDFYHLVFQWAENGNLQDVWRKYSSPCNPVRNHGFAVGFAERLLGLAQGLQTIHKCHREGKPYGIHGDIKPANILSFKGTGDQAENVMGILKYTDFGYTTFHGTDSVKNVTPKGISLTYMAPEYELLKQMSQPYDIWSLGCVFLEYVTWHLHGGDGVKDFEEKRMEETRSNMKEDYFFTLDCCSETLPVATAKSSVKQHLNDLRSEDGCSMFIWDVLNYIEDKLLRIYPENRATIPDVVKFLQDTFEKCQKDEYYTTASSRFSKPPRSSTVDSAMTTNIAQLQPMGVTKGPSPLPQRGYPSMKIHTARNPTKDRPEKANYTNTVHGTITRSTPANCTSETPNTEPSNLQKMPLKDVDTSGESGDVEGPTGPPRETEPSSHPERSAMTSGNLTPKELDDCSSLETLVDKTLFSSQAIPSEFSLFGCFGLRGGLLRRFKNRLLNRR